MVENMEWYRVFYVTAKAGSFTLAAEQLFITQPAVTHHIKQLEHALGGQLFFRSSKGVHLTHAGQMLYTYIEQAMNLISTGERKLAELHQLMEGEIRIGAGDTLCKHYLLPYLEQFHESYPNIHIQVTNRTTPETIQLLKAGKIDFGIVNLPISDKQVTILESWELIDCFITSAKYKHSIHEPLTWEQLIQLPLILFEKGSNTRSYIDQFCAEQGVEMKPEIELGSEDLLVEFVRRGLGVACVVKNFIQNELDKDTFYEVAVDPPLPPRKVGIITMKQIPLTSAANTFIEMLPIG